MNPNPAPGPTPLAIQDLGDLWRVTSTAIVASSEPGGIDSLPVGTVVDIGFANGSYVVNAVIHQGAPAVRASRFDIEDELGFPLDWYQNAGDGSFLDFGYGWDRLRVAGGGGQFSDYVQYGVRVIALGPDDLFGYEAKWSQDFLGQPRYEWLASVMLQRVP